MADVSRATIPSGRRRGSRAWFLIGIISLSAITTYIVGGWLRPARFPSVQRIAAELNVAVAGSDETRFLNRVVTEYRMAPAGQKNAPPVFTLYTDEHHDVVGFAALQESVVPDSPPPTETSASQLISGFIRRFIGDEAFRPWPRFTPVRTPMTPPDELARSAHSIARGFHIWTQDYGEYGVAEDGTERLTRTRRYWVITVGDWEIPKGVSAR